MTTKKLNKKFVVIAVIMIVIALLFILYMTNSLVNNTSEFWKPYFQ